MATEATNINCATIIFKQLDDAIPGATPRVAGINRALADDIEARGLENVASGFAASLFAPGRLATSPHLGAAFIADMLEAGSTSVCAALRAIADWDASDRLSGVGCPVTVIAGDAEPDIDRQALLAQLIGASFEVLDGTGHLAPVEAPADVARAITEMTNVVAPYAG